MEALPVNPGEPDRFLSHAPQARARGRIGPVGSCGAPTSAAGPKRKRLGQAGTRDPIGESGA